jgi:hypothetical protein
MQNKICETELVAGIWPASGHYRSAGGAAQGHQADLGRCQRSPLHCWCRGNRSSLHRRHERFDMLSLSFELYVPLILKMREINFFCGQITLWAISRDILRGSKKSRTPQNIPRNGP